MIIETNGRHVNLLLYSNGPYKLGYNAVGNQVVFDRSGGQVYPWADEALVQRWNEYYTTYLMLK